MAFTDTTILILISAMAIAGLSQSLTGFGAALIAMPVLAVTFGSAVAVPMFAPAAFLTQIVMIARYREALMFRAVWRMIVAALIAIPIGIYGAAYVNERFMLTILGVLLVGYGLFGFFAPRLPRLVNPRWGYLFGFASGLLSGAYNTGGPPYVVYGTMQGWTPQQFKANLQGAFVVGNAMVIGTHAVKGNYTLHVLQLALVAMPAILAGLLAGLSLDRFVRSDVFNRAVQLLLMALGLSLIW